MTKDNRAVVERRYASPENFDDFPTPPWATRALIEHVLKPHLEVHDFKRLTVWEPAANRGFMSRPLGEYFGRVVETDVFDYGRPVVRKFDFLTPPGAAPKIADWIITNPPFALMGKWIRRALVTPGVEGVALLARTSILESQDRYEKIFSVTPPSVVAQFVERVPMFKGRIDPAGSTATSYCWLVWRRGAAVAGSALVSRLVWIPPCRKDLERPWDY